MICKGIGITALTLVLAGSLGGVGQAQAQEGLDDEAANAEEANTRQIEEDMAAAQVLEEPIHYGVGIRLRYVTIPKFIFELFVEEAKSGIGNVGFGLDFIRRRGDLEIGVGLEYESMSGTDGFWLEKGEDALSPGEAPDFLEFDGFGWITLDVNFIKLKQLGKSKFAIRYGGGFGIGLVLGQVLQTDSTCSSRDINRDGVCTKNTSGQVNDPADLFPVYPVFNALAGVQFRPIPQLVINAEVGIRTAPFIGLSSQYFF